MFSHRSNPLDIPEIIAIVLELFCEVPSPAAGDAGTPRRNEIMNQLFQCTLVNRTWAHEASTVLWGRSPTFQKNPLQTLAGETILSMDRKQYYSKKVRSISFAENHIWRHPVLALLRFPRLTTVWLDACRGIGSQYPGPSLRPGHVLFASSNPQSEFIQPINVGVVPWDGAWTQYFRTVRENCPRLSKLKINEVEDTIDAVSIRDFIAGIPTIENIRVNASKLCSICDGQHTIDGRLHLYALLADNPSIRHMGLDTPFDSDFTSAALRKTSKPYRHLRALRCRLDSSAIEEMTRSLENLETLRLTLTEPNRGNNRPFRHIPPDIWCISRCSQLRTLRIKLSSHYVVHANDLRLVANGCRQLECIDVRQQYHNGYPGWKGLSDAKMEGIASMLPRLRLLRLFETENLPTCRRFEANGLTARSLTALGSYCRELEHLELAGRFNPASCPHTHRSFCLFPCLKHLHLNKIIEADDLTLKVHARHLVNRAPNLYSLRSSSKTGASFVEEVWAEYSEISQRGWKSNSQRASNQSKYR